MVHRTERNIGINKPGNIMFLCILFYAHFERSGSDISLYMYTYKNAENYEIIMDLSWLVTSNRM